MNIEETIVALREVTDMEGDVDPGQTLASLEIDSIDMLEWIYTLDEQFELNLDLDDERLFDGVYDLSLAEFHARLLENVQPSVG
jgi:acyl carrier protein